MSAHPALGSGATESLARVDALSPPARGGGWAVAVSSALGLGPAAVAAVGVAHLPVEAETLEAAGDVAALGCGVTGVAGGALVDVDASAVLDLVSVLAVADGLVVLGAAGAAAALGVATRV